MLGAFNVAAPAPGETGTLASAIAALGGLVEGAWGDGSPDNTHPKAFVNIILFDKNYNFLDVSYAQVTSSGTFGHITASYTVKEAGYAFMYVSNEQPVQTDVYFDDVTMSYTPSNILQYNEYYAHGLQNNKSWTRDNSSNSFLYNGAGELNATTNLYDLAYRNYDAVLGRFHQIDPMASSYFSHNPYNYALNDPINSNDPLGLNIHPGAPGDGPPGYNDVFAMDNLEFAAFVNTTEKAIQKSMVEMAVKDAVKKNGVVIDPSQIASVLAALANGQSKSVVAGATKGSVWCSVCGKYAGTSQGGLTDYFYGAWVGGGNGNEMSVALIKEYERNQTMAFTSQFAGEALAEVGIGGDLINTARNMIIESKIFKPSEFVQKLNAVQNYVVSILKDVKDSSPLGRLTESYVTAMAATLILYGGILNEYNNTVIAPKIREMAPEYYKSHIGPIDNDGGKVGGGGNTTDY